MNSALCCCLWANRIHPFACCQLPVSTLYFQLPSSNGAAARHQHVYGFRGRVLLYSFTICGVHLLCACANSSNVIGTINIAYHIADQKKLTHLLLQFLLTLHLHPESTFAILVRFHKQFHSFDLTTRPVIVPYYQSLHLPHHVLTHVSSFFTTIDQLALAAYEYYSLQPGCSLFVSRSRSFQFALQLIASTSLQFPIPSTFYVHTYMNICARIGDQ